MKSHGLERFVAPPPTPAPTCAACKAYRPEVVVPLGEGALELCWLCAHHHVDHGVPLSECAEAQCEHTGAEIYPREYLALRQCEKEASFPMRVFAAGMGPALKPHGTGFTRNGFTQAVMADEYARLKIIVDGETRPLLECAKRAAAEVAAWPAWKRGDIGPQGHVTHESECASRIPGGDCSCPYDANVPAWRRGRGPDRKPRASRSKP